MATDSYDITIDAGADWFWTVRWLIGVNRRSAAPVDITGYSVALVAAPGYARVPRDGVDYDVDLDYDGEYVYDGVTHTMVLSTENGGASIIGPAGVVNFHATAEATTVLPVGRRLKYEVLATSPDAVVSKLVRGLITVNPGVL